jgi:hypothetical protein
MDVLRVRFSGETTWVRVRVRVGFRKTHRLDSMARMSGATMPIERSIISIAGSPLLSSSSSNESSTHEVRRARLWACACRCVCVCVCVGGGGQKVAQTKRGFNP